jgi:3-deoxy-D-manno-octulosonate 8-phosphate phosphatase (KDO 8-P phosphatase)
MMDAEKDFYLKASQVRLIIFDVDGVLTDGGIYFSDEGLELKRFNSLDGHGIKMIQDFGIEPAVISARSTKSVEYRMANLGVKHFYQGQDNKLIAYNELVEKLCLESNQVAYMGDDVIDLPVMLKVGLPIAVANAHDLVKENSILVTKKSGGSGAVREVCDMLLKSQNNYEKAIERYML